MTTTRTRTLSPAQERTEAELERSEAETRRKLQAATAAALLLVARRRRASLAETSGLIARSYAAAIVESRQDAARIGIAALVRELRAVGVASRDLPDDMRRWWSERRRPKPGTPGWHPSLDRGRRSNTSARTIARRFATRWREAAQDALDDEKAWRDATRIATRATASHGELVAVTENSRAFSQARREYLELIEPYVGLRLQRVWMAELDACPVCWGFDGETAEIGKTFPSGSEPGSVHPRCRCWEAVEET